VIFLGDFSFVRIFLKHLELDVRKIEWFCQQGEGFCMHVFSSLYYTLTGVGSVSGFLTYRKGGPSPHVSPPVTYFAPTSENHIFKRYWQKIKNNLVQDNVLAVFSLFCNPTLLNVIPLILICRARKRLN
jgi:hypothetical protein